MSEYEDDNLFPPTTDPEALARALTYGRQPGGLDTPANAPWAQEYAPGPLPGSTPRLATGLRALGSVAGMTGQSAYDWATDPFKQSAKISHGVVDIARDTGKMAANVGNTFAYGPTSTDKDAYGDAAGDSFKLATNLFGVNAPAAMARQGTAGMFGGSMMQRDMFDAPLSQAKELAAKGYQPEAVYARTGWVDRGAAASGGGADDTWRNVFSDRDARFKPDWQKVFKTEPEPGVALLDAFSPKSMIPHQKYSIWQTAQTPEAYAKLGDIFDHPEAYRRYPDLPDMRVTLENLGSNTLGSYARPVIDPKTGFHTAPESMQLSHAGVGNEARLRETMLHEMQHAVQYREGHTPGGNPNSKFVKAQADEEAFKEWSIADSMVYDLSKKREDYVKDWQTKNGHPTDQHDPGWLDGWKKANMAFMIDNPNDMRMLNAASKRVAQGQMARPEDRFRVYEGLLGEREAEWTAKHEGNPYIFPKLEEPVFYPPVYGTPGAVPREQQASIRAYHGSPHDFDKFSIEHIGRGEGAQSYGRGLYFAENEGTAKSYRDALARNVADDLITGPAAGHRYMKDQNLPGMGRVVEDVYAGMPADLAGRRYHADDMANYLRTHLDKGAAEISVPFNANRNTSVPREVAEHVYGLYDKMRNPGHMYEVNINAKPEQLLNWDATLKHQPPALQKLAADVPYIGQNDVVRGQLASPTGEAIYGRLRAMKGDAAPKVLQGEGIPGVSYLDQFSRGTGAGTSNYAIWDDKIIDILRKYGIAGMLGGAGGAAAMGSLANEGKQ